MSKKDASSTMFPPPQTQPSPSPASSHANGYGRGSHGRALAAGHHAVAQVLEEAEELHGTRRSPFLASRVRRWAKISLWLAPPLTQ